MNKSETTSEGRFYSDLSKRFTVSAIALSISLISAFICVFGYLLDFRNDRGFVSYGDISVIFAVIFIPITLISLIVFFAFYFTSIRKIGKLERVNTYHKNFKIIIFITHSFGLLCILISIFFSIFDVRYVQFLLTRILAILGYSSLFVGAIYLLNIIRGITNEQNQNQIKKSDKMLKIGGSGILLILLLDTIIRKVLAQINSSIFCSYYSCTNRLDTTYYKQVYILNYVVFVIIFSLLALVLLSFCSISKYFKESIDIESTKPIDLIKLSLKDQINRDSNLTNIYILISTILITLIHIYFKFISSGLFNFDEEIVLVLVYSFITIVISLLCVIMLIKLFWNIVQLDESEDNNYKEKFETFILKSFALILLFAGLVFEFMAMDRIEFHFFLGNSLLIVSVILLLASFIQDLRINRLFTDKTEITSKDILSNPVVIFLASLLIFIFVTFLTQLIIGLRLSTLEHYSSTNEPYRVYSEIYWQNIEILVIIKMAISVLFMLTFPFVLNSLRNSLIKNIDRKKTTEKIHHKVAEREVIKLLNIAFLLSSTFSFLFIAISHIVLVAANWHWVWEIMFPFVLLGVLFLIASTFIHTKYVKKLNWFQKTLNMDEKKRKISYNLILYSGIVFFSSLIFNFLFNYLESEDYIVIGVILLCSLVTLFTGYLIRYIGIRKVKGVKMFERFSIFAALLSILVFLSSFLIRLITDRYDWHAFDDDTLWIILVEVVLFAPVLVLFLIDNYRTTKSISEILAKQSDQRKKG